MGIYLVAVNTKRREYFTGHSLHEGAKYREFSQGSGARALIALMLGRWRGELVDLVPDSRFDGDEASGWRELTDAELRRAIEDEGV